MAFYGVGIDTEVARLICEIKLKLANKFGGFGLRQLALAFRRADVQCQGFLHEEDFLEAINGIGIFVRQIDQQALIKYFTQPGCGVIYPAFVDRFRDPLSPQREAVVKQAFDSADINGTGFLEPVEVSTLYKSNQNFDFVLGRKSEAEVVEDFFAMFDKNQDGKISYDEWKNYYLDISSMTGGDDAFVDIVKATWGNVSKEAVMSEEEVNGYINLIRERLVTMTKGVEDEFQLQKLYKTFDKHNSGMLSMFELDGMLLKLNIVVPKRLMQPLFRALDKNKSGYIEFDEFSNFVLYNPYKR